MKHRVIEVIGCFLKKHYAGQTLLLGFSGGPDSLALFHGLLNFSVPIHLAHVDHGWREESSKEASQLQEMASRLQIPFHLKTITPNELQGNWEAASREIRHQFFSSLCQEFECSAVLLGHHADDQAETVLKELLEGKSLPFLSGMLPISKNNDLTIWRPLLSVKKGDILEFLKQKELTGLDDYTNRDPKYLRSRMRATIIPRLNEDFGKEVHKPLLKLAEEALEWRGYLDEKIRPYINQVVADKFGIRLDLSESCPDSQLELKHLIRSLAIAQRFTISREIVSTVAELIASKAAHRQVEMGKQKIYVDRRRLFIPSISDEKGLCKQ